VRFVTRYSSDAFTAWIEDNKLDLLVIADSSKIILNMDSEPYIPFETPEGSFIDS
jgi:hypothetical protein